LKVLCPDRKLSWFVAREWSAEDIETAKSLAVARFESSYSAGGDIGPDPEVTPSSSDTVVTSTNSMASSVSGIQVVSHLVIFPSLI
jgi:hypothetical protein